MCMIVSLLNQLVVSMLVVSHRKTFACLAERINQCYHDWYLKLLRLAFISSFEEQTARWVVHLLIPILCESEMPLDDGCASRRISVLSLTSKHWGSRDSEWVLLWMMNFGWVVLIDTQQLSVSRIFIDQLRVRIISWIDFEARPLQCISSAQRSDTICCTRVSPTNCRICIVEK
jgi:hypothetical protein